MTTDRLSELFVYCKKVLSETVGRNKKYIPVWPTEQQALFLTLPFKEALYGGAAGGGKSVALLTAALQYVHLPGYNAILFRRTLPDLKLPGALIDLSMQWLSKTDAEWRAIDHKWIFPSGATLTFGFLDHENTKYRYQSSAFHFIGFDELTQFPETRYRYLFSRLRRAAATNGIQPPLRMRAATNPGGIGHDWVHRRFIIEGKKGNRLFIPAKLEDNPHLDREAYEASLDELDPVTRSQLRHGDWDIKPEGNMFKRAWFRSVDQAPKRFKMVFRAWDLAATDESQAADPDYTAGVKIGLGYDDVYYILDMVVDRLSPLKTEELVLNTAKMDGPECPIVIEEEGGASGKSIVATYQRNLRGWAVWGSRCTGDKVTRAMAFSAASERREVTLVRAEWNTRWLDELGAFPAGGHDDVVDATVIAFNTINKHMQGMSPELMKKVLSDDEQPEIELEYERD